MTFGFRCGILSRKSLYAISEDIEVDCFASHGLRWIQTASTQGQMTSVCTNGSLPCKNTPDLLKVSQNLEPIKACLIPFLLASVSELTGVKQGRHLCRAAATGW